VGAQRGGTLISKLGATTTGKALSEAVLTLLEPEELLLTLLEKVEDGEVAEAKGEASEG